LRGKKETFFVFSVETYFHENVIKKKKKKKRRKTKASHDR
jgi:hypothetical protein